MMQRKRVVGLEGHPLEKKVARVFTAAAFISGNGREFISRSGTRGLKLTRKGWLVFNTGWTWAVPSILTKQAEKVGIDAETFYWLFCQARFRGRSSGRAVILSDGWAVDFASGKNMGRVVESPHGNRVCLGEGACPLNGPHLTQ